MDLDPKRDTPKWQNLVSITGDGNWVFLSGSGNWYPYAANTMNIRYQFAEGGMINHSECNFGTRLKSNIWLKQAIGNSKGEAAILAALQKPPPVISGEAGIVKSSKTATKSLLCC